MMKIPLKLLTIVGLVGLATNICATETYKESKGDTKRAVAQATEQLIQESPAAGITINNESDANVTLDIQRLNRNYSGPGYIRRTAGIPAETTEVLSVVRETGGDSVENYLKLVLFSKSLVYGYIPGTPVAGTFFGNAEIGERLVEVRGYENQPSAPLTFNLKPYSAAELNKLVITINPDYSVTTSGIFIKPEESQKAESKEESKQ